MVTDGRPAAVLAPHRAAVLGVLAVVTVASCAVTGPDAGSVAVRPSVPGPSGFPAAAAARPVAQARTFDDGVRFDVPVDAGSAGISAAAAYATCTVGPACYAGSAPVIELGDVTVPNRTLPANPDQPIRARLAYILSWSAVPCAPAGGPPGQAKVTTCSQYQVVDAQTGSVLYAFQESDRA